MEGLHLTPTPWALEVSTPEHCQLVRQELTVGDKSVASNLVLEGLEASSPAPVEPATFNPVPMEPEVLTQVPWQLETLIQILNLLGTLTQARLVKSKTKRHEIYLFLSIPWKVQLIPRVGKISI